MGKLDAFREILQSDVPTSSLTWLRLGGPIEHLARPRSEEELLALLKACNEEGIETRVIGDGSAILVSDVGAPGLAIQLSEPAFCQITVDAPYVVAGAGAKLGRLATTTASSGLSGIEGLVGVPGVVGGATVTNASTTDGSLGQWIESVRVAGYDGSVRELTQDDLVFGYRSSNLDGVVVLSVKFRLEPDSAEELAKRLQKIWIVREQSRPNLAPGEGLARMFKNPNGQRAAEFIADAGFRGAGVGGASVCEVNPNLIKTSPQCTSDDVKRLITLIQQQARERFGVELESELTLW